MHKASATPPRIRCNACGGRNSELARFCSRCGVDLAAAPDERKPTAQRPTTSSRSSFEGPFRRCPKCHADNPKGAKFCCACATDLLKPSVEPIRPSSAKDGENDSSREDAANPSPSPQSAESSSGRRICPGCHVLNPAQAAYCGECGVQLPQDTAVPTFGRPAGFWIRALAGLIDAAILVLLLSFLTERVGLPTIGLHRVRSPDELDKIIPGTLLAITTASLYAMLFVGAWGGTIGKLLLGLRIVRFSDGAKVPYGLALGRCLAHGVSLVPLGLGYLWIALNPSKRGWHDYLGDTRVVHTKPE